MDRAYSTVAMVEKQARVFSTSAVALEFSLRRASF
jgi:hypothetical protein